MKYIISTQPPEQPTYTIPQERGPDIRSSDKQAALARAFSSEAEAHAYMAEKLGDPKGLQNEIIGVEHMYTYETISTVEGDDLPSNRYGTIEAIGERFGDKVRIVDAPPASVDTKDFCPDWPGFARKGFTP